MKWTSFLPNLNHGCFKVDIYTSYHSILWTTLNAEVQLLSQLMSGKDSAAKIDDSFGKHHLVVCCDGSITYF